MTGSVVLELNRQLAPPSHWYYEDFIREEEPQFPPMALKTFSRLLFHACPLLRGRDHDQAFQDFLEYKTSVPVCGVIMLNPSWSKVSDQ